MVKRHEKTLNILAYTKGMKYKIMRGLQSWLSKIILVKSRNWITCNLIDKSRVKSIKCPKTSGPSISWYCSILYACRIKPEWLSIYRPYIRIGVHTVNNIGISWLSWNSCGWRATRRSVLTHTNSFLKFFCIIIWSKMSYSSHKYFYVFIHNEINSTLYVIEKL